MNAGDFRAGDLLASNSPRRVYDIVDDGTELAGPRREVLAKDAVVMVIRVAESRAGNWLLDVMCPSGPGRLLEHTQTSQFNWRRLG